MQASMPPFRLPAEARSADVKDHRFPPGGRQGAGRDAQLLQPLPGQRIQPHRLHLHIRAGDREPAASCRPTDTDPVRRRKACATVLRGTGQDLKKLRAEAIPLFEVRPETPQVRVWRLGGQVPAVREGTDQEPALRHNPMQRAARSRNVASDPIHWDFKIMPLCWHTPHSMHIVSASVK